MSLNHIELPPSLIAEMYRTVLVEVSPAKLPSPAVALPAGVRYLGKNQKQVTILVRNPSEAYLAESHLQFLTRILEACKLNLGDVAIVNVAPVNITAEMLNREVGPCKLIMFGVSPGEIELPFDFPVFKLQSHGTCTYLQAPPISELVDSTETAKAYKSQLWSCLKQLFQV